MVRVEMGEADGRRAPALERLYRWQERMGRQRGNPLSSRLDGLTRRHLVLGSFVQAVSFFVVEFLVFSALFGFHLFILGIWAITAALVLVFNIGYYRWLRRNRQTDTGTH